MQNYDGTTAKLTIPDAYVDDSGDWSCEAWNEIGQASQTVRVTIKGRREENLRDEKSNEILEKRGKPKRVRKQAPKAAEQEKAQDNGKLISSMTLSINFSFSNTDNCNAD